ncbi:hypothetical protein B0T19DRAFT_406611 [Cercophora scortea]|uniref:DNA polymerase lambda n=1 Tax=Cercophora scortea TaxID=314031 RepID=A0AAE0MKY9_9PEZI|nr:hypothetical protein B0T19DRAFT_406611 [Cercophora scortea]
MDSQSLQQKAAFFKQLDALNSSDNDDDDLVDSKEQEHREKCQAFFAAITKKKRKRLESAVPVSGHDSTTESILASPPRRPLSAPAAHATTPISQAGVIKATPAGIAALRRPRFPVSVTGDSFVAETPAPSATRPPHASLLRRSTMPVEQSPSMGSDPRKRKRQSSAKEVAEAEQIFRGLSVFYIPNDDIAPARKLRIAKAQEYGAEWVRTISIASHVFVDKRLQFKDIQSLLPASAASLTIVNEDYPIDCIKFRTLLNPDQNRYRVTGYPSSAPSLPGTITMSQTSNTSLLLKEQPVMSRDRDRALRDATPPRNEESSHSSVANETGKALEPLDGDTNNAESLTNQPPQTGPGPSTTPKGVNVPTSGFPSNTSPTPGVNDELSGYIKLLNQYKDLPLDAEDDDALSSIDAEEATSEDEIDESSEDERARKTRTAKTSRTGQKTLTFEDRFSCNQGGTKGSAAEAQNPNARTIEVLQSMCDYYTRIDDTWRILAYRKAISTLRRQSSKITTQEEAFRLPHIGPRLAQKIEEIVNTNKLKRLEYANDEPLDQVLETFLKIYGVGISRANKWISQGFRTLEDLNTKATLSANQLIGIDHFDDLNTRIPRAEVAALADFVKKEAHKLDPRVEILIGGSYRRGADSSGDIDLIITKKGTTSSAELVPFLETLLSILTARKFLVATLASLHSQRQGNNGPGSKWHGCCVLPSSSSSSPKNPNPNKWRRIDLLLVPESEYGAALIYFTGNDIFNRSLRLLASKKGMRLNQRGLYKEVMRGPGRAKVTEGQLVEGRDERRIFEILGVKWRDPAERWC